MYNQLKTLRKCLIEVKAAGGVDSPRELYPYSMKVRFVIESSPRCLDSDRWEL